PPAGRRGPRGDAVLVVEDNATAREAMRQFLTRKGFRAETAADGEEALRLARELHPRVITLDVLMPGMDGWDVLTALKADPEPAAARGRPDRQGADGGRPRAAPRVDREGPDEGVAQPRAVAGRAGHPSVQLRRAGAGARRGGPTCPSCFWSRITRRAGTACR